MTHAKRVCSTQTTVGSRAQTRRVCADRDGDVKATFALQDARDRFLADGFLHPELARLVRPDILVSWRRSKLSGARPGVEALPFDAEINVEGSLYRAAQPVLARIGEQLYGLQAGVLLSDRNARIIQRWAPDPAILRRMDLIASESGSSGAEQYVGTNGIGTIVEDRQPHIVVGAEHFAEVLTSFTCVGAPIFHPMSRRFEGVVTLNADASAASPLLTSLIASTAQAIERRLLEISSRRERALLDAFLMANRAGRPVAVIGDDVLLAGPHAAQHLRQVDQALLWQEIREVLSVDDRACDSIGLTTCETTRTLTCTPVLLDDRPIGAIIEIAEPESATGVASSAAGGHRRWPADADELPGNSPGWAAMLRKAAVLQDSRDPLMITGEGGVGKLLIARAISRGRPFEVIDCLAAPIEGGDWIRPLFGQLDQTPDMVVVLRHLDTLSRSAASVLSVFLDELTENCSPVRVIATARPIAAWAESDIARRIVDQLGVQTLEVPPLRDRREDIPELVAMLGRRFGSGASPRFTVGAIQALSKAPWPGNVRELSNVIRSLVSANIAGEISADRLPHGLAAYSSGRNLTKMERLELDAILDMIQRAGGNKVETARLLGISRSTLYRKMRRYRVDPERTFY